MSKKCVLLDNLLAHGFEEKQITEGCLAVRYEKVVKQTVDVAFYGQRESVLKIWVVFNPSKTICQVMFFNGGFAPFKQRVYDTVGKRTWNAIAETARCKGFEI